MRRARKTVLTTWKARRSGRQLTSCSIILEFADRLKLVAKKHRAPSNLGVFQYDGNVIGGALIGMGMAITGACPGTALVQAGTGMTNGMLVALGGAMGALLFIKLQWAIKRARSQSLAQQTSAQESSELSPTEPEKSLDIAKALDIQPLTLLLTWVPMCLTVMLLASATDSTVQQRPDAGLVSPKHGGALIGVAQLATILLTGHDIGVSAAYEDVARWINEKVVQRPAEEAPRRQFFTPSVVFACGIICSAAVVSRIAIREGFSGVRSLSSVDRTTAIEAIAGGMTMVFGARLAGGCTSGHGISGLAQFSLSSLVTTIAMFSTGITTATIAGSWISASA